MKPIYLVLCYLLCAGFAVNVRAAIPKGMRKAVSSLLKEGGASVTGYSEKDGIFVIGIGRHAITQKGKDDAQHRAELEAKKAIVTFLNTSISSSSQYVYEETTVGEQTEFKEFFSQLTTEKVDELLKGAQLLRSGKNADGEIEVVYAVTERATDASHVLAAAQKASGDNDTVRAKGVDSDRQKAEQKAIASAVEQVAGTMVVSKTSVNEADELRARLATTAGALVEEYRILEEHYQEGQHHVIIVAKVSKRKIYESYRSYFKALDNPTFTLQSTDLELEEAFKRYFIEKGVHITDRADEAHYLIKLNGKFAERKNPITGKDGTMLSVTLEVCSLDGQKTYFHLPSKRYAKDSDVLTQAQRREDVSNRIFRELKTELDTAFHQMVIRMLDDAQ